MNRIHFINLTNGIEYLPEIPSNEQVCFIRIQSTLCEVHNWDRLISDIDYNLLMNLAIGNECVIYDTSQNKPCPKSLFQGMEFIKYVIYRIWFDKLCPDTLIKTSLAYKSLEYFNREFESLSKFSRNRIKYFRKYLLTSELNITLVFKNTINDSNNEFYTKTLERWVNRQ